MSACQEFAQHGFEKTTRADEPRSALHLCVLGGAQDSGNLGVSALGAATSDLLGATIENANVLMQQYHTTAPPPDASLCRGQGSVENIALRHSRQLRDRHGTRQLRLLAGLAGRVAPAALRRQIRAINPALDRLSRGCAALDISCGDAFSDIYGMKMFRSQVAMKRLMLSLDIPLVLMPQTFGPFYSTEARRAARDILRSASLVVTRDAGGLEHLGDVVGQPLDDRFHECPDVAFTLQPKAVDLEREPFLAARDLRRPLVGLNVSGLLYFKQSSFGIRFSYRQFIERLLKTALEQWDADILIVPHVICAQPGQAHKRDDRAAAQDAVRSLPGRHGRRLGDVQESYDAKQIKYLIGQCDFFIGARMHACIAAVSQGVPTAVIAYSKKAGNVMELAGAAETVVDPRAADLDASLAMIYERFQDRENLGSRLLLAMTETRRLIHVFFAKPLAGLISDSMNDSHAQNRRKFARHLRHSTG